MSQIKKIRQLSFAATLILVFLGTIASAAETKKAADTKEEKSEKMKQRLEQLFTWRVSDRLQFTPEEEQRFSAEFKKLSAEKASLAQELDTLFEKIEKEKSNEKVAVKLLSDYQKNLKKTSDLQIKELQIMKKLFGNKRMVEYVLLKREMTQKFKDVLSQNGSVQAKAASEVHDALNEPEVIQEK